MVIKKIRKNYIVQYLSLHFKKPLAEKCIAAKFFYYFLLEIFILGNKSVMQFLSIKAFQLQVMFFLYSVNKITN